MSSETSYSDYIDVMSSQLIQNTNLSQEASACHSLMELIRGSSITAILNGNQDAWDKFVFYVFERRFGWAENSGLNCRHLSC
jgi:hypothetical protein